MFIRKLLFQLCFGCMLVASILAPTAAFADAKGDATVDETTYFNQGVSYETSGQYDLAVAEYTKAIEINPQYAKAYISRGAIYYSRKNQYDLAIGDYAKAIEINPQDPIAYTLRGHVYMSKRQYDLAVIDFSKSVELNPQDKRTYFNRGLVYYLERQYELAIADFRKTTELDPQDIQPYYGCGEAHFAEGKYDLAVMDYTKVTEINPQISIAYYRKGLAYSQLKLNKNAVASFQQYIHATKPNPNICEDAKQRILEIEHADGAELSADELYLLGNRKEKKQEYAKAIEYYSEVIRKDTNYKNIYAIRGLAYVLVGNYDLALADYLKAIEINPNESGFYHSLGNIYTTKQKYDLAIKEYIKAIELKDTYFARKERGKTYFKIHKYDLAMDDFNRMEELWSGRDETAICKASLYGFLGKYEECISISQEGLSKFVDHPILLFLVGQSYEKQGNIDEAINYYKKAYQNQSDQTTRKLTTPVKNKLGARLAGDWNSYKDWIVGF